MPEIRLGPIWHNLLLSVDQSIGRQRPCCNDMHNDAITAEDEQEMNELFDSSDEGENDIVGF